MLDPRACVATLVALSFLTASSDARPQPTRALNVAVVPLAPGTGCPDVGPAGGVRFEVDSRRDGVVEWLTDPASYAFLAIDTSGNGAIDGASELVGNRMGKGNALFVLVDLATPSLRGPAMIDSHHPLHRRLLLWSDRNRNGLSELSEVQPLGDFMAVVGLGIDGVRPATPDAVCRYRAWGVRAADWTGAPRGNDKLHYTYDVTLRTAR